MEESTVTTVGNTAESPTKGKINVLLKSGGNDFHGSGFFAKTGHRFEGDNLTPESRASPAATRSTTARTPAVSSAAG